MIVLRNIRKNYGEVIALDGVSHTFAQGKITAIIGPNGSGKTTLLNIISGIASKDKGKIYFGGADISGLVAHEIASAGISRTFQQVSCFQNLTILEHLLLCMENQGIIRRIFANCTYQKQLSSIKDVLSLVGISNPLNTPVSSLSYGQKKLVLLAMAILKKHKVLLLDEPVAGVNPLLREKIKKILITLKDKGKTIIIVEHDISFVREIADAVVVLDKGRVIYTGDTKNVLADKEVIRAYIGTDFS